MKPWWAWIIVGIAASIAAGIAPGQENLVKNPSFEEGADARGVPHGWQASGDPNSVAQTLRLDRGRDGKGCARLACTRFAGRSPASHAMLCQMGVPVQRGRLYRLAFWARAEQIGSETVSIALSDTAGWQNCGLEDMFVPTPRWERFENVFRATRDVGPSSRLQIWFNSTGTLWIDDVELRQLGPGEEPFRPGQIIPPGKGKNLVPNASFECGPDGWGSAEWDRVTHWGGRMNRLFGEPDESTAFEGRQSLKIDLSPQNQPVCFFDYYELYRTPVRAPLAASQGFIEVEPGKRYTLSVSMKARQAGTPARLAVRQFQSGSFEKAVRVSTTWDRYSLSFTPTARWCYVLAGPDLRITREEPTPPQSATLWLDAVQLEKGDRPTEFSPRAGLELGIASASPGNVFDRSEPLRWAVVLAGAAGGGPHRAKVELALEDFFGKQVWSDMFSVDVPAAESLPRPVILEPDASRQGFLRLVVKATSGGETHERSIRLAVIPKYKLQDSRFGVNHAYPWPHLLDECREAGLVWVRDWSLKWQEVEPEKGRFTFTETDYQIDRPRRHGLQVLGLLPFPSSNWSSSAPESVSGKGGYPQNRARVAYTPRDLGEFENYVEKTVAHYKGRIRWWHVFNEPLYTDYSLPRKLGYDGATYARLAQAAARAARRADPECRVLAGIGAIQEGQILDDFARFFAAGGLAAVDAVDVHHYPGLRPPEFLEGLLAKLNALMEKHGGRKPIWITEYGYYADDEPAALPVSHSGFDRPLSSEARQAEYAVRWAVIALAGGVEKVFYHAGTCQGINSDNLEGVFYKYAGQPRKIYAAQAVMAHFLTPSTQFVKPLDLGPGVKAFLFREGPRLVAVVWSPGRAEPKAVRLANDKLELRDLMGRPQSAREFTPGGAPVYVLAEGLSQEAFEAGLGQGAQGGKAGRPSIVYILADDLGYGDVKCLNPQGKIATPCLDRLAAGGMIFTDAHASSSVCTPTRYGILTGRYNWRSALSSGVLGGYSPRLAERGRLTVPALLKQHGYQTACIGKWHLGRDWPLKEGGTARDYDDGWKVDYTKPIANGPSALGFDYYYGISASLDMPPYVFIENDRCQGVPTVEKTWIRRGPAEKDFEAIDVLPTLVRKAVQYVDRQAAKARAGEPFFLYLAFTAPHTPIVPTAPWQGKSGLTKYGDFVMQVDAAVREVLEALQRGGLADQTLVIFTSDNGCSPAAGIAELVAKGHHPSFHFRGHKADIYDGGHRIPFFARWPGKIKPGSASDQLICLTDLMATCADILGVKLPDGAGEDSVSILPALVGKDAGPLREAVVHHSVNGSFSIRQGSWKLELCPGSGGWSFPQPGRDDTSKLPLVQLYDLASDVGEKNNLQGQYPEVAQRLTKLLEKYVADGRSTPGAPQANTGPIDIWKAGKDAHRPLAAKKKPGRKKT